MKRTVFPFTAIVGQEKIKKALILNAINPSIGGVLIKGDRGTGKTTAVRALADLLPEIEIVENSPFNADENSYKEFELYKANDKKLTDEIKLVKTPMNVVELPLGATEDRVVGSLDIEKALHMGIKALEPGLLAQANNNILYIDEINLLDDNLVDILLDAAAYGVNIIEREGISISHPSKFILIGTMNPEEGELRGQLSDRIGLEIEVEGILDVEDRILIMQRREEFEKDPIAFNKKFEKEVKKLQNRIIKARNILENIEINTVFLEIIARITLELGAEGHRSDIAILKTAKTIASFNEHMEVQNNDLEEAVFLVLGDDNLLFQRIQKIKREIEKREEDLKKSKLESIEESLQESLQDKLGEINQKLDINLNNEKEEIQDEDKSNDEHLDLSDSISKKTSFVDDSDFKAKDDLESKINEGKQLENFNEIETEERKFDIKKSS
ncbi:ATP-binding protein [Methanobrevibacter cuticularis]|nr:ATP-binding protein [Methanobrevibacter cuticularis]